MKAYAGLLITLTSLRPIRGTIVTTGCMALELAQAALLPSMSSVADAGGSRWCRRMR